MDPMSYDLTVRVNHGDGYTTEIAHFDPTFNLAPMFVAAGLPESLRTLDGMSAVEAAETLYPVWRELRTDPVKYSRYNPANGWGDQAGALWVIRSVYLACRQHPKAEITVT
jgi:hypothetical protein